MSTNVNFTSAAADVRAALAVVNEDPNAAEYRPAASAAKKVPGENPGETLVVASLEQMKQWLPGIENECLSHWSKMPVWAVKMYLDRKDYETRPGLPYKTHHFAESVDIVEAVQQWRLRVKEAKKGVAVFEGSFTQEPMSLTVPPTLLADAQNAEVLADTPEVIEQKRLKHTSRVRSSQRWEKKGVDPKLQAKIEEAERRLKAKKEEGQQKYQLGIGWVNNAEFNSRKNEIKVKYG